MLGAVGPVKAFPVQPPPDDKQLLISLPEHTLKDDAFLKLIFLPLQPFVRPEAEGVTLPDGLTVVGLRLRRIFPPQQS